jgi:predicted esterase
MVRPALAALALVGAACSSPPGATARFELPRAGDPPSEFYALPFPNDLRLRDDGTVDLDDHVRPNELIDLYLDTISTVTRGFGTNAALFVRFSAELDPASLPADAAASLEDDAAVMLVDVDPDSPERGARTPLLFRFSPFEGESIGDNWLGCLPYPGRPLRPATTYALLLTDRLRAADGGGIARDVDFDALLGDGDTDADVVAARARYAPLLDWVDEPGGVDRADLVDATMFTTQDPVGLVGRARARILADVAAPVAADLVAGDVTADFAIYSGTFEGPNFQTGLPPYDKPADGGAILVDDAGEPIVQRTETLRFAVTLPPGTAPDDGWPVVIYAHGTGGDYTSFIDDGTAARLAAQGLAVISMDQPMHGSRGQGVPDEKLVFNYENPIAALDVIRQGAIDDFQLLRLIDSLDLDGARLDPERIAFMGHSQGGITGTPFVAWEPRVQGAVLSGAGGLLYQTMLHKEGIPELVAAFIRDYPLDQFNNLLALVQMFGEPADPANYGPMLTGLDIYQSEGFVDSFTPNITIEALGVAAGLSPVAPVLDSVAGFFLRGLPVLEPPVSANRDGHTAVFVQYQAASGNDGHFVVFDVPAARRQHAAFLGTLARDGRATLVP